MEPSTLFRSDNIFNMINKKYITLKASDKKRNNEHIQEILYELISRMKKEDAFFEKTFSKFVYAGSFYKNTKIAKPEEYDINIVIKLPINYNALLIYSHLPGYIMIKLNEVILPYFCIDEIRRSIPNFIDDTLHLNQIKFYRWIESVLSKVTNKLCYCNHRYELYTCSGRLYRIAIRKTGPAFTLVLEAYDGTIIFVDLVPVIEFNKVFPQMTKELALFDNKNWYAIPKLPVTVLYKADLYWRLSFSDQEKEMLAKYGQIKPVIRQIKKLRDTEKWYCLKSYYIETVSYHMLHEKNILPQSATAMFMQMLKRIHDVCKIHRLEYFWDSDVNLFDTIQIGEMRNVTNRLSRIIGNIEKSISHNPFIIAEYILTKEEFTALKTAHSEDFPEKSSWCTIS